VDILGILLWEQAAIEKGGTRRCRETKEEWAMWDTAFVRNAGIRYYIRQANSAKEIIVGSVAARW
jgi:hypothetical protein